MKPSLSLVIPFYNEAGNILPLTEACVAVLTATGRPFEAILVNDGSTDGTAGEIAACAARWPQCRELRMERNSGQAVALLAGLHAAAGDFIVTMDGDLPRAEQGQAVTSCCAAIWTPCP